MDRVHRFPDSDIISLVHEAPPRHDLGESYAPNMALGDLLTGAELADLPLDYGSPAGDPELRAAVAAAHGVAADDVVITVGGMHALFLLAFTLCDPGDPAVVVTPHFPVARDALRAVGADVREARLHFDEGYRLDPELLRAHLGPATRLVCHASPQNPSGVATGTAELRQLLAVVREAAPDAYLVVDETYRAAGYDTGAPSAAALDPKIIAVSSLSKTHGAAGLRIGWAVSRDPALVQRLVVGKFSTVVTCPPVTERLALRVFEQLPTILRRQQQHLAAAAETTRRWIDRNAATVEWVRPDAGAICCIRLRPSVFDGAAVARFRAALAANGVRLADGTWFGDDENVFRLGFGALPAAELDAALDAVSRTLDESAAAGPGAGPPR